LKRSSCGASEVMNSIANVRNAGSLSPSRGFRESSRQRVLNDDVTKDDRVLARVRVEHQHFALNHVLNACRVLERREVAKEVRLGAVRSGEEQSVIVKPAHGVWIDLAKGQVDLARVDECSVLDANEARAKGPDEVHGDRAGDVEVLLGHADVSRDRMVDTV